MDWKSIGGAILGLTMYKLFGIWPLLILLVFSTFMYCKDKRKNTAKVVAEKSTPGSIPTKPKD